MASWDGVTGDFLKKEPSNMSFKRYVKRWLEVYTEINDIEKSIISSEAIRRINTNKPVPKHIIVKVLER